MSVVLEAMDIVRASERLTALKHPLCAVLAQVADVRDISPDLDPELDAIEARVSEAVAHVVAASAVLSAKLMLIRSDS